MLKHKNKLSKRLLKTFNMKPFFLNFLPFIGVTIVICFLNFKHSGGDIFIQFMIVCLTLLFFILNLVIRCIVKFNIKHGFYGLFLGVIVSYIIFLITNYLSIKHP